MEVRIVCGRTIKHTGSRHRIESVGAGSLLIYGEIRIIAVLDSRSKFLLTGLTPSEAELEVAESLDILEEGLLLDLPGECEGREEGPVLTETGRTVVTYGSSQEILVSVVVVGTSEEGNEVVLGLELPRSMGTCSTGILVVGLGIEADIVVVLAPPEVLPLITAHDVEMMASVEVLIVLGVGVEGKVALGDLIEALAAVIDTVGAVGRSPGVLLSVGEVRTESGVEPESLETVDLIVDLCAADDRTAVGDVLLEVQQRDRVRGGVALPGVRPCIVVERSSVSPPLEIVREVGGVRRSLVIDALGRVHLGGSPDSIAVCILRSGVHSLGVEVDVEMIVKERRVEIDGSRSTLEI